MRDSAQFFHFPARYSCRNPGDCHAFRVRPLQQPWPLRQNHPDDLVRGIAAGAHFQRQVPMVKKAASPWLRGLLRAGKQQQRAFTRALTVMAAPPAPPRPRPKSRPKPRPVLQSTVPPPFSAPPGKWLASHFTGPGSQGRLSYWLYLPDHPPTPAALPLVVMLHGCDQSATEFAQGTRMNHWAQKLGYAVLYPQQSRAAHPHRCWKWYDRATQQGGGEVRLIAGMVGKVARSYPIDCTRIYIGGMSAGAGMANIVALHHPDMFAAIGLHSGPMFGAGHSPLGALGVMKHGAQHHAERAIEDILRVQPTFPPLPTMLIHGDEDDVVRPVNRDQLQHQARLLNRVQADERTTVLSKAGTSRTNPHVIEDTLHGRTTILRVARIARLKHAWSGGDARLAYNSGTGPDASRMLLDFFARHRRVAGGM